MVKNEGRNLEDFYAEVVRQVWESEYTNEYGAELLVKISKELFAQYGPEV